MWGGKYCPPPPCCLSLNNSETVKVYHFFNSNRISSILLIPAFFETNRHFLVKIVLPTKVSILPKEVLPNCFLSLNNSESIEVYHFFSILIFLNSKTNNDIHMKVKSVSKFGKKNITRSKKV